MGDLADRIAALSPEKRELLQLRLKKMGPDVSGNHPIPRKENRQSRSSFLSPSSGCGFWTSWSQGARSITFQGRCESKVHSMRKSWSAALMRSFDAMKLCVQCSQRSKKIRFRLSRHQQMFPCR